MSIKYDLDTSTFLRSSPPAPIEGIMYYDNTKRNMQLRNNTTWHAVMTGSVSQKMWVYRNSAETGWLVDASISDKVISIKGGIYDYNIGGGNSGGNWTGLNHHHTGPSHNHAGISHTHTGPSHTHTVEHNHGGFSGVASTPYDQVVVGGVGQSNASHTHTIPSQTPTSSVGGTGNTGYNSTATDYTGLSGTGNTSEKIQSSWRPAAAVGTLQYLDV